MYKSEKERESSLVMKISLSMESSIEYFLNHFRYGEDYEASTILVDAKLNVIAFFDRGTKIAHVVQTEADSYFDKIVEFKGTYHDEIQWKVINKTEKVKLKTVGGKFINNLKK